MDDSLIKEGWIDHVNDDTIPPRLDDKYEVMLIDGTVTEDFFTGLNWYYYDYTEIAYWREIKIG